MLLKTAVVTAYVVTVNKEPVILMIPIALSGCQREIRPFNYIVSGYWHGSDKYQYLDDALLTFKDVNVVLHPKLTQDLH